MEYIFNGNLNERENTGRLSLDLKTILKWVLENMMNGLRLALPTDPTEYVSRFCCQMVFGLEKTITMDNVNNITRNMDSYGTG
jgi:hypothetical protein